MFENQNVLIIGAGRQGLALARYLASQGAHVTLNDRRNDSALQSARNALADLPIRWVSGGHPLSLLDACDLVCPSGGVPLTLPLVQEAIRRGIPLSNDSQIFLQAAPCRVIGITGSAGKTTTTTLTGRIAQAGWKQGRVWVGGNIGNPLIADVDAMQAEDLAVMELSSFQLEIMRHSPQVAAVLNITPNHLDRHGTMQAYTAAKAHILRHQTPQDTAVLNREEPGAWGLAELVCGRLVTFGVGKPPEGSLASWLTPKGWLAFQGADGSQKRLLPRQVIQLRGEHNLRNCLAAAAIALSAGLPAEAVRQGIEGFSGVPHRLELVRRHRGVAWYNDSIATAPERAMAAIRSFEEPIVLLAGGRDKNLPWEDFAALVRQRVDHVITFGEAADLIADAIGEGAPRPYTLHRCATLEEAVQQAAAVAEAGDVVLLSPGGTSFDAFRDFAERGEKFRAWVQALP
ncbi:MAG: UDP-N-acetylmuramoyl-L-alanine--D-glutamate ligase [Anaerolineae bacterium]|nr:MAG: UDP-N-acetylmuramoyl-L-alanine--D-glutamate ligase [Anaerolineae bacterium]